MFDTHNDVAVLRVARMRPSTPLQLADPQSGASVAILGYPLDGGLTATPGRIGRTATVLTQDALGHGPVARTITAVAGQVEHGDSGGPAVDAAGKVESMIFAARVGSRERLRRSALDRRAATSPRPARTPCPSGSCAP